MGGMAFDYFEAQVHMKCIGRTARSLVLLGAALGLCLVQACGTQTTRHVESSPTGKSAVRVVEQSGAGCGSEPCFRVEISSSENSFHPVFGQTGSVCFAGTAWSKDERMVAVILSICHGSPFEVAYDLDRKSSANFLNEHEEMLRVKLEAEHRVTIKGPLKAWVGTSKAWALFAERQITR